MAADDGCTGAHIVTFFTAFLLNSADMRIFMKGRADDNSKGHLQARYSAGLPRDV